MTMRSATPLPILQRLLNQTVQPVEWTITPPPHDQQKESYIVFAGT
jgi:hypothetical protein